MLFVHLTQQKELLMWKGIFVFTFVILLSCDVEAAGWVEFLNNATGGLTKEVLRTSNKEVDTPSIAASPMSIVDESLIQGYVDKIKNNQTLVRYAEHRKYSAETNWQGIYLGTNYFIPTNDFIFVMDDECLLEKWVNNKITDDDARNDYALILAKCAYELRDSPLSILFYNNRAEQKYFNYSEIKTVKEIDNNGNVVEKIIGDENKRKERYFRELKDRYLSKLGRDNYGACDIGRGVDRQIYVLLVAILDDSGNIINNVCASYLDKAEKTTDNYKSLLATRENTIKSAEVENEKIISEIKSGNYNSARNCGEIANALNAQSNQSLVTSIQPTLNQTVLVGDLSHYDENENFGTGLVVKDFNFAKFKTNSKTKWFNKQSVAINTPVYVLGKYVMNDAVTLVTGAERPALVLEAICVSPAFVLR